MRFCPSLYLRSPLAAESRTAREGALGEIFLPRRELQFSRNPHRRATDNLAGSARVRPLIWTGRFGKSAASNLLIDVILGWNPQPKRAVFISRPPIPLT